MDSPLWHSGGGRHDYQVARDRVIMRPSLSVLRQEDYVADPYATMHWSSDAESSAGEEDALGEGVGDATDVQGGGPVGGDHADGGTGSVAGAMGPTPPRAQQPNRRRHKRSIEESVWQEADEAMAYFEERVEARILALLPRVQRHSLLANWAGEEVGTVWEPVARTRDLMDILDRRLQRVEGMIDGIHLMIQPREPERSRERRTPSEQTTRRRPRDGDGPDGARLDSRTGRSQAATGGAQGGVRQGPPAGQGSPASGLGRSVLQYL